MERSTIAVTVFAVALMVLTHAPAVVRAQCNTCLDGSPCCGSNPTCCTLPNSTSTVCCDTTELCCQGFCCDASSETCCSDPVYGGVCCVEQETFCCPSSATYPNRCCPRWTVCCENDDQDGCCAPETMNGAGGAAAKPAPVDWSSTSTVGSDSVIYALFMEVDTVDAVHINATTGAIIKQLPITGFHNFGEMTRVFMFDGSRTLFYYLEANYSFPPPTPSGRPVRLWTIDPITGLTTSMVVPGVYNLPTAWVYDCTRDVIVLATQMVTPYPAEVPIGYTFYTIAPASGDATIVSESMMGSTEADEWAGWFHGLSVNGSIVYRQGFKNVTLQQEFGLGITQYENGGGNALSWWTDAVPLPPNHGWYQSLQVTSAGFLSLAPLEGIESGYDLVRWNVGAGAKATVIASFGNANPPPFFGPIADIVSCDGRTYVAAIVHDYNDSDFDRWALVVVDLSTDEMNYLLITPLMDAKMSSISGVGLPQPDGSRLCRRSRA